MPLQNCVLRRCGLSSRWRSEYIAILPRERYESFPIYVDTGLFTKIAWLNNCITGWLVMKVGKQRVGYSMEYFGIGNDAIDAGIVIVVVG